MSLVLHIQKSIGFAKMRTSSHRYNIETVRHGETKRNQIIHRPHCCTDSDLVVNNSAELPFFNSIIKDKTHVLCKF